MAQIGKQKYRGEQRDQAQPHGQLFERGPHGHLLEEAHNACTGFFGEALLYIPQAKEPVPADRFGQTHTAKFLTWNYHRESLSLDCACLCGRALSIELNKCRLAAQLGIGL